MKILDLISLIFIVFAFFLALLHLKDVTEKRSYLFQLLNNVFMFFLMLVAMRTAVAWNYLWINDIYLWVQKQSLTVLNIKYFGFVAIIAFLFQDLLYYTAHRISHKVRPFWLAHRVHHSSHNFDMSIGFRHSFLYPLLGMKFFWLPLVFVLGLSPLQASSIVLFHFALQFFGHIPNLRTPRWLDLWIITPHIHRHHHSRNPQDFNSNFGGIFTFWDHIFGTFKRLEQAPQDFGVSSKENPTNFISAHRDSLKDFFSKDTQDKH